MRLTDRHHENCLLLVEIHPCTIGADRIDEIASSSRKVLRSQRPTGLRSAQL